MPGVLGGDGVQVHPIDFGKGQVWKNDFYFSLLWLVA
jgi:hypothetical protein